MLTQSRIILGGELSLTEKAKTLFNRGLKLKTLFKQIQKQQSSLNT